jgi:hypothetical protein
MFTQRFNWPCSSLARFWGALAPEFVTDHPASAVCFRNYHAITSDEDVREALTQKSVATKKRLPLNIWVRLADNDLLRRLSLWSVTQGDGSRRVALATARS